MTIGSTYPPSPFALPLSPFVQARADDAAVVPRPVAGAAPAAVYALSPRKLQTLSTSNVVIYCYLAASRFHVLAASRFHVP